MDSALCQAYVKKAAIKSTQVAIQAAAVLIRVVGASYRVRFNILINSCTGKKNELICNTARITASVRRFLRDGLGITVSAMVISSDLECLTS